MAQLTIEDALWQEFLAVAERQRRAPQELAAQILRDYMQQVADGELLARSERASHQAPFLIEDAEEIVRQYRRRKG